MAVVNTKYRHRSDVDSGASYMYFSSKNMASLLKRVKKFFKEQHKAMPFEAGDVLKMYGFDVVTKVNNRGRVVPVEYKMTVRF